MKAGDFSSLAEDYSRYRPGYSSTVRDMFLAFSSSRCSSLKVADVGAGTGIWTRMLAEKVSHVTAIEPNENMRFFGKSQSGGENIHWQDGCGESTGLGTSSVDLLTMASSFHWVDFDAAIQEFDRVLTDKGIFLALWNPRLIEVNPLLVEIENKVHELCPEMQRVSSGRSKFCDSLFERMSKSDVFRDVIYLEGRHVERQSPEHYIGLWKSVNDIQVQLGVDKFQEFMGFVESKVSGLEYVEATYQTRAWMAIK
jgi:ubiquinone/menaquinone biosynthesis C-methylase UbiE